LSNAQRLPSVDLRAGRSLSGWRRIPVVPGLVLIALSSGCSQPVPTSIPEPVTLRIGVAVPKTNEASTGVKSFVGNLLSEQLVGMGWNGRPVERLASGGWSEDGLVLTLTLRKNLQFHDGTPLDVSFVRANLEQFLAKSVLKYQTIVSVATRGDDQVTITLSRPDALLFADLSNFLLSHPTNPSIGMGPYRLLEGTPVRLAAFDNYYGGRPPIDFVEVHEFEEQRSSWAAMMRGEIDAVHEISPGAVDFVQADGQTAVATFPFTRPYFISLFFNTNHPVLKEPKVRQALSYSIDRKSIIKLGLNGQGIEAEGPVWPFHWAYSSAPRTYVRNLEAARLGLEAAGLRMQTQETTGRMPSRLRFKCLTLARYERMALTLQKQLSEVGVDLEVKILSGTELVARMQAGDFESVLMERTSGRSLVWTYFFFHSKAMSLGYKSADAVLDNLRRAPTDADVRNAVSDFQQIMHDDPPAIFIAWPQVARVVSTRFVVPQEEKNRDVLSSLSQWKPARPGQ
jgi:peptide/nickel transport system substrate-binding protein